MNHVVTHAHAAGKAVRALALAIAVLLVLVAQPARAAAPTFFEVPIKGSFVIAGSEASCGFPILFEYDLTLRVSERVGRDGTLYVIERTFGTSTLINEASGSSASTVNKGPNKIVVAPDGNTLSFSIIGHSATITLPKYGLVFADVGLVREQAGDPPLVFTPGQHDLQGTGDLTALCAALR